MDTVKDFLTALPAWQHSINVVQKSIEQNSLLKSEVMVWVCKCSVRSVHKHLWQFCFFFIYRITEVELILGFIDFNM